MGKPVSTRSRKRGDNRAEECEGHSTLRYEIKPRTRRQADYINTIRANPLTFGIGPAGTGKTFVAATMAVEMLLAGSVERIVLTRPVLEAGEELGFLPGSLQEKYQPWITPLWEVLERQLGPGQAGMFLKERRIEALPLAFMRGRTLENAFVVLDEAQNVTRTQMKLFLTRMGEYSRVVVDGDPEQTDLPVGASGLRDAVGRLRDVTGVGLVEFERADIVRSGLVQCVVTAYEKPVPGSEYRAPAAL